MAETGDPEATSPSAHRTRYINRPIRVYEIVMGAGCKSSGQYGGIPGWKGTDTGAGNLLTSFAHVKASSSYSVRTLPVPIIKPVWIVPPIAVYPLST